MAGALKFREDGTFKIVHLTDFHWRTGDEKDLRTLAFVEEVLRKETPDLVVITGDIIHKKETADPLHGFEAALAPVVDSGIPWAFVFGNHDLEADVETAKLAELLQRLPNSHFATGPASIQGMSNYIVQVQGSQAERTAAALYMLDSGAKTKLPFGGSAWIHRNQVEWYAEQSVRLTAENSGVPLPSLAFFHIPLPEYNEIWDFKTCYGTKNGSVSCPKVNSGLFAAMVEMGDVMGTFAGHNHHNDFYGDLHGIRLCYSRVSGYGKGKEDFKRGARMIVLQEGKRGFDTWQRLDDGSVLLRPPVHPPAYIDPFGKRNTYPVAEAKRIIDVDDVNELPKRFRMVTDAIRHGAGELPDLTGFRELKASASGQFSLSGLRLIQERIGDIFSVVVDLRQECHGFVGGRAFSWYAPHNGMNKGLAQEEVLLKETRLLNELNQETHVEFEQLEGKSVDLGYPVFSEKNVLTEEELVGREGMGYVRFCITDHHRPLDLVVDSFIRFVAELPADTWLHFHCRGGMGRASTFMLMYDMLRNAGTVSLAHILQRHKSIGGRDMNANNPEDSYKYEAALERLAFVEEFYEYAAEVGRASARVSWTEWCAGREAEAMMG